MSTTGSRASFAQALRLVFAAIAVLCLASAEPALAAGKKVALIIGNSTYANGVSLPNPISDAQLVEKTAITAGFEVTRVSNLNEVDFHKALIDFQTKADTAEVALIYYAGHGIENGNKNWLIPTDAVLNDPRDLQRQAISFDEVTNTVARSKFKIILLDACREDPYKAKWGSLTRSFSRGLMAVDVDYGTIVLFATAAGQTVTDGAVGGNSYFATAISKNLAKPGQPLSRLADSITNFVNEASGGLQSPKKFEALPNDLILIPVISEDNSEYAVWGKAQTSNTLAAYKEYLAKFPNGQFRSQAVAVIAALSGLPNGGGGPPPPPPPPIALTLPSIPGAPQFYAGAYPSCRDSWGGLGDNNAKLAAIGNCSASYDQFKLGTLNPFPNQMANYVQQVQSISSTVTAPNSGYSEAQKAEFNAAVQSRVQDASAGGVLMQDYLATQKRWEEDSNYIAGEKQKWAQGPLPPPVITKRPCNDALADPNNCTPVAVVPVPPPTGGFYVAPPIARQYGAGGFPIMPEPPAFDYGPYPTCKNNWQSVTDPLSKVQATIDCKNAYTAYKSRWLNKYREAMNSYSAKIGEIYTAEVAPPHYPTREAEVQQFYAEMRRRVDGVLDGGFLMADHAKASARFDADFAEVIDSYNRSTGCKGYPTPAGLAPNPNC